MRHPLGRSGPRLLRRRTGRPRLYNGFPASAVTEEGATKLGIHLVETLVSRGVLLDLARAKGQEILEPGYPITPGDLDAACAMAGVTVAAGDVVLVRTGQPVHLALRGDRDSPGHRRSGTSWPTPGRPRD